MSSSPKKKTKSASSNSHVKGLSLGRAHKATASNLSSRTNTSHETGSVHGRSRKYADDKSVKSFSMKASTDTTMTKKFVHLENSYKMEPDKKMPSRHITAIIAQVLEENLESVDYSSQDIPALARHLAEVIKQHVKGLNLERYKIITWVAIYGKTAGGIQMASRNLWDKENDNFATASYQNRTLHAIGNVFAVYHE